jgi:hypothetical protein
MNLEAEWGGYLNLEAKWIDRLRLCDEEESRKGK